MSKNFDELLAELSKTESATDTLVKAMGDEPVAPMVDDEDEDDADGAGAAADAGADDKTIAAAAGACDDKKPVMAKSFEFTDESGTKHEAIDATELVKSLVARQDSTDGVLAKALESFTGVIQKQGDLIKSLSAQVKDLSSQGRGRKAVLNVQEKPDAGVLAKSEGADKQGLTTDVFFAKASTMFDAGKLSGKDLNTISVCIRGNHPIDPSLVTKVISS